MMKAKLSKSSTIINNYTEIVGTRFLEIATKRTEKQLTFCDKTVFFYKDKGTKHRNTTNIQRQQNLKHLRPTVP